MIAIFRSICSSIVYPFFMYGRHIYTLWCSTFELVPSRGFRNLRPWDSLNIYRTKQLFPPCYGFNDMIGEWSSHLIFQTSSKINHVTNFFFGFFFINLRFRVFGSCDINLYVKKIIFFVQPLNLQCCILFFFSVIDISSSIIINRTIWVSMCMSNIALFDRTTIMENSTSIGLSLTSQISWLIQWSSNISSSLVGSISTFWLLSILAGIQLFLRRKSIF